MHAVVNHPPGPAHDVPLLLPETVRAAQKVIEEAMQKAATPRWIVPDVGMPRIVYYRGVPPIEGAGSALCHTCRLGDACPHGKPARPPYISAVDEWDLLPDA
jgi:hypothetical protein